MGITIEGLQKLIAESEKTGQPIVLPTGSVQEISRLQGVSLKSPPSIQEGGMTQKKPQLSVVATPKVEVDLTIIERITLLNSLPPQGDILTLKLLRELREALSFNENENLEARFMHEFRCSQCEFTITAPIQPNCPTHKLPMRPTGMLFWNPECRLVKTFKLGPKAVETIQTALKNLNSSKALTDQHFSLYEKFVGTESADEEVE